MGAVLVSKASQRSCKTRQPEGTARQAKAQQPGIMGKAAHPDARTGQMPVQRGSLRMPGKTKEAGAAGYCKASPFQHVIELASLGFQLLAHVTRPFLVLQGFRANRKRRAGDAPWPQGLADPSGHIGLSNGKAEAQPGQSVKLAEGAQHDHGCFDGKIGEAEMGGGIDEAFVQHEPATARLGLRYDAPHPVGSGQRTVGIVGMHDDAMTRACRQVAPVGQRHDGMARRAPACLVLAIGGAGDRDAAISQKPRQPLDQGLRTGCRDNGQTVRHAIGSARSHQESGQIGAARQALPERRVKERNGPGMGIDAGRQVQPVAGLAAMKRAGLAQVAAMLHRGNRIAHPLSFARSGSARKAVLALGVLSAALGPAHAEGRRIVSINMCTDQLLLDIADPADIIGLSPYSGDVARSWARDKARIYPALSGTAEEIMVLRPDVVLAGSFTRRATRAFIAERGVPVETFSSARTFAEVEQQIARVGIITGQQDRARARIADLRASIDRVRQISISRGLTVLPLQRRGWVSGADSIVSELFATVGLKNAAVATGRRSSGQMSLEAIVALAPDALLLGRDNPRAEDQGRAFLMHPALLALFPPERRLSLPESLTVCGGPMLAEALERLAAQIETLKPREKSVPDAAAR